MILGIGNDLVDIRRIEKALSRHGERFEMRCFTAIERKKAERRKGAGLHGHVFAKRFAAKEACAKALGTGFSGAVYMKDIGVIEDEKGRPFLELRGGALDQLNKMTPRGMRPQMHLSLSDEPPFAQAFVIIEALA
tara:strand:+ start:34350 stop:34754 length:405 start_codon:yes stop_codon:yes gene_type:complete